MTEYEQLLRELLGAGVRFLVIGGYATVAHGYVRATDDLDIWVDPSLSNAKKAYAAIKSFGATVDELTVEDLVDPYTCFRIGEERGRKIDVVLSAEGLVFQDAWDGRQETEFAGLAVPFVNLLDLIRNKETVGRHKDLADVEALRALHKLPKPPEDIDI